MVDRTRSDGNGHWLPGAAHELTTMELLAVALAAFTGVVHFFMAYEELGELSESLLFLVAGVIFFAGVVLFVRDHWPRWLFLVGAVFTAVQIPLWILEGMEEFPIGVTDKAAQAALVVVLLVLFWQTSARNRAQRAD